MGLDYSFELLAPRSGASALLGALAGQVGEGYGRALRAALPWAPQEPGSGDAGIRGLRAVFDIQNCHDLVVMVGIDKEVRRYFDDSNRQIADHTVGDKAGIGLVYMRMYAGQELAGLIWTEARARGMLRGWCRTATRRR